MCKMKSAIILKDRVFVPDYDSHTDMLSELGIEDNRQNAERLFVRAELTPRNNDVFSSIDTWDFNVDQDIRPEWFVEEIEKQRMIDAVKAWAKDHILVGINGAILRSGVYYLKDCKNVKAWDSATVEAWGSATVEAYDSATVKACGSATVEACGSATVKACGSATVFNSTYFEWKKQSTIVLSENATFKDNIGKVIYQSGDWQFRLVEGAIK